MKFSAAAFTVLSLCHSVVNGDVTRKPPSLRGGRGGQESSQPSNFQALGHQKERRRLEQGGYIVLFDDTVKEVEDFAVRLSNALGKNPYYIIKNTVHGVYLRGLSDADVEFLPTIEGVASIEQNQFLDLYEGLSSQQRQPQQEVRQQEDHGGIVTTGNLAINERVVDCQTQRRRRRRKNKPPPTNTPIQPVISNRQQVPWNIQRVHGPVTYTGSNKAWILDTGIMLNHPDLNVDKVNAYNVFTRTNAANDENGHGTRCAGIIAAIDNDIGTVGVAAGAIVVPVKVFDSNGQGNFASLLAGVDYVASKAKTGDVANISLGGSTDSALDKAVTALAAKGVIVTIAAGNTYEDAQYLSPARVVATNVYTISSMNQSGRFSGFSNYGNVIDYSCPGEGLKSTDINGGLTDRDIFGTSIAAPHAVGVFLLGNPTTDGVVAYDPDGNNDPILVHGK
jgi:Subtilase family